jgi:peptidoglycan hydrolase-like protein with peptidoglycan-binding domain
VDAGTVETGEGLSMDVKFRKFAMVTITLLLAATLALAGAAAAEKQSATPAVKAQKISTRHASRKTRKGRVRGQKTIDGQRVRQIQEALIREHYLKGEPSGKWDASTQQAMHRYQADQGWQSKSIPDSRALIRLGLGPDSEHLLNPESAMTMAAAPAAQHSTSRTTAKASSAVSTAAGTSIPASSVQISAPSTGMSGAPTR